MVYRHLESYGIEQLHGLTTIWQRAALMSISISKSQRKLSGINILL